MYNLRITGLTKQQDMEALVKVLLRVPGLNSQSVSAGLKVPPFQVLSVEEEQQAISVKSALEKFGAMCEIENTAISRSKYETTITRLSAKQKEKKSMWMLWLAMIAVIAFFALAEFAVKNKNPINQNSKTPVAQKAVQRQATESALEGQASTAVPEPKEDRKQEDYSSKDKNELKGDLSKNPYNSGAWKALYENFEKEGDTASARKAKDSYDKALKAQMVLASLAKTFGNGVRVEITENAVYYRTSKDLTYPEFFKEAEKLRDSVNVKFPSKDMVLENYTPDNDVQSIRLKPAYRNTADSAKQ